MGIELIRSRALKALHPPADMATADWIEANIFLPPNASALPGKMKLWAYQRGICDALDDPGIERLTVLKSARIGSTALLSGIIASHVANAPAPILAVQPTADDARDYAVDLEGVFSASPALRGLLSDEADDTGRSTMLNRRFPGGSLKF
jgi:phage terminase large subunit GpA-like protein